MTETRALATFHTLFASEQAFKRGDREQGWSLLEQAEQQIPSIDNWTLFNKARRHADRVWSAACACDVQVDREARTVRMRSSFDALAGADVLGACLVELAS